MTKFGEIKCHIDPYGTKYKNTEIRKCRNTNLEPARDVSVQASVMEGGALAADGPCEPFCRKQYLMNKHTCHTWM